MILGLSFLICKMVPPPHCKVRMKQGLDDIMYVTMLVHDKHAINVGYFCEYQTCQQVPCVILYELLYLSESQVLHG